MKSINPANGDIIAEYDQMSEKELHAIAREAAGAQLSWKKKSFNERAAIIRNAADLLEEEKEEYAELMAREMGKPLAQGESEAEKCAWVCRYYAENAEEVLSDQLIASDADKSYI